MTIKYRDLREAFTTSPPLQALAGGRLARADRVRSVHTQVDSLLGNDRSIVARVGLHGATAFQIPSTDPTSALGDQRYPWKADYRTVARVPAFAVLPGHFLMLSALIQPTGMTQKLIPETGWVPDGAYGEIRVTVTWGGPSADTTVNKRVLANSGEAWAAESAAAGASWAHLRRIEIPLMYPDNANASSSTVRVWSEGTTAAIVVDYRGGVRCVDVVIQQVPFAYARNVGVDSLYSSALVTDGAGALTPAYPVAYPIEERSATDPTYGTALLADVADRQHHKLGPVLAYWTAWNEGAAVDETDLPMVTKTSTSFVDMLHTTTSWAAANPGWSLSSGALAQQFKTSNRNREMRGWNACVPVRVWAYCSRVGTGNATLRFQAAEHSVVEIAVDSDTPAWRSAKGYLRCGAHASDPSVLQVLGKAAAGAGTSISISSLLVEYVDL